MLIIDIRENKLIDLIKIKLPTLSYQTTSLPIGDIIIRHIEDNITYEIILERKCLTDMIASIKDGRYKEQKIRLLSEITTSSNKVKIAYLLEGSTHELRLQQDKSILIGSVISSIFRDNIPILQTSSLHDTLYLIQRLNERLIKDYKDFFPNTNYIKNTLSNSILNPIYQLNDNIVNQNIEIDNPNITSNNNISSNYLYLQAIKKNKKDNMTPTMWNMNCLCGIPGVSSAIAIKIAERYPSIRALLEAYQGCIDTISQENLLADIILIETDKQRRRIGNVISKRIYEYLQN